MSRRRRYARLIASGVASRGSPRTSYGSEGAVVVMALPCPRKKERTQGRDGAKKRAKKEMTRAVIM